MVAPVTCHRGHPPCAFTTTSHLTFFFWRVSNFGPLGAFAVIFTLRADLASWPADIGLWLVDLALWLADVGGSGSVKPLTMIGWVSPRRPVLMSVLFGPCPRKKMFGGRPMGSTPEKLTVVLPAGVVWKVRELVGFLKSTYKNVFAFRAQV